MIVALAVLLFLVLDVGFVLAGLAYLHHLRRQANEPSQRFRRYYG